MAAGQSPCEPHVSLGHSSVSGAPAARCEASFSRDRLAVDESRSALGLALDAATTESESTVHVSHLGRSQGRVARNGTRTRVALSYRDAVRDDDGSHRMVRCGE